MAALSCDQSLLWWVASGFCHGSSICKHGIVRFFLVLTLVTAGCARSLKDDWRGLKLLAALADERGNKAIGERLPRFGIVAFVGRSFTARGTQQGKEDPVLL